MNNLENVNRFEIIDHTACDACGGNGKITIAGQPGFFDCPSCHGQGMQGREVVFWNSNKQINAELQDDGRTLKIFINHREAVS